MLNKIRALVQNCTVDEVGWCVGVGVGGGGGGGMCGWVGGRLPGGGEYRQTEVFSSYVSLKA